MCLVVCHPENSLVNAGGERGIRTPLQDADSLGKTSKRTGKDTGIPVGLGHELSRVVTAWAKLPPPLRAAILAIVNSVEDVT